MNLTQMTKLIKKIEENNDSMVTVKFYADGSGVIEDDKNSPKEFDDLNELEKVLKKLSNK